MPSYNIGLEQVLAGTAPAVLLRVAFGDPAQNDEICREAARRLAELTSAGELTGGGLVLVNGPASLPVACVVAHAVGHLFEVVGVFDPKLGAYVVAISHGAAYSVGDLIPAGAVTAV